MDTHRRHTAVLDTTLSIHNVIHAISELFERFQVVERNLDEELQNLDSRKYQAFTRNYGTKSNGQWCPCESTL